MRIIFIAGLLLLLCGCATNAPQTFKYDLAYVNRPPKPMSPALVSMAAIPMVADAVPLMQMIATAQDTAPQIVLVPVQTNYANIGWDRPRTGNETGYLLRGGTNGVLWVTTNALPLVTNHTVSWIGPPYKPYFFALSATNKFGVGEPSNVLRLPAKLPANAIAITWATNRSVTIQSTSNLVTWSTATNLTGTNATFLFKPGIRFFRVLAGTNALPITVTPIAL